MVQDAQTQRLHQPLENILNSGVLHRTWDVANDEADNASDHQVPNQDCYVAFGGAVEDPAYEKCQRTAWTQESQECPLGFLRVESYRCVWKRVWIETYV